MIADQAYYKTRDELKLYEDSEVSRILAKVPDYYYATDQTLWGVLLRVAAEEYGRIEYAHTYDVAGKDLTQLNPADVRRFYNDLLGLSSNYYYPGQTDVDYQNMVVALKLAFQRGSTLQSLSDVITAYLGTSLTVQELFKMVGQSGFSTTDRNTVRIATQMDSTSQSQSLIDFIYPTLDLAKPAHVGLSLQSLYSEGDDIGTYLTSSMTDYLQITILLDEPAPADEALWLTSEDGTKGKYTPETHVAPVAKHFSKGNITLSGLGTQAGGDWTSPLTDGDIIRVGYQTDPTQNGFYAAHAGAWTTVKPALGDVSPILDRVWEIQEDALIIYEVE